MSFVFVYHLKLNSNAWPSSFVWIWETGLPIVGEERQSKKYQKDKDQFPPRKIKIVDCLTSQYSAVAGLHFVSTEINWKWNHYLNLSNLSYQPPNQCRRQHNYSVQDRKYSTFMWSHFWYH